MDRAIGEQLSCQACGGQCGWAPEAKALVCQSCGTHNEIAVPEDVDPAAETPFDARAPEHDVPVLGQTRSYSCHGCGGEVLFVGPALSEACPYCNSAVVLGTSDIGYETKALIPFRIAAKEAETRVKAWIAGRLAAPGNLAAALEKGRLIGLYAPFWTFDSEEAVQYWATYTTGSGDKRRTHRTSGKMQTAFDDMLMPASPHVTPLIRDGILHDFDPGALKPYAAGYLAGFAAERHHQSVAQGLVANEKDKDILLRNRIRRHVNKPNVKVTRYQTDTTGIHYRRILLPVWMLHYSHGGKDYKVVTSGIDGRTFGERPLSRGKLLLFSAAISLVAIAFGWAWGAAGLL